MIPLPSSHPESRGDVRWPKASASGFAAPGASPRRKVPHASNRSWGHSALRWE